MAVKFLDYTGLGYFCSKIKAWCSATFAAITHNQASSTINAMTGYSKPNSGSAIATSDSLNSAIGKLEAKVDAYDDSNYVHLTGAETIEGSKTFNSFLNFKDVNVFIVKNNDTVNNYRYLNLQSGDWNVGSRLQLMDNDSVNDKSFFRLSSGSKILTGRPDGVLSWESTLALKNGNANIEFYPASDKNHGGHIDFHYNGEQSDYSSRIVERARGYININGVDIADSSITAGMFGETVSLISRISNNRLTNSVIYTSGQYLKGSSSGQTYAGSSNNVNLISYPANGTAESNDHTKANVQNLRIGWGNTYFQDIFMSPNNHYIWHRDVQAGTAYPWRRVVEENATGITSQKWDISIAGSADRLRSCIVGANDGSTNQVWYKVASYNVTDIYDDIEITFLVENTYENNRFGLLRVMVRSDDSTVVNMDSSHIHWLSTTFQIHSDFVLVRPNSNTSSVELWTCLGTAWVSRRFVVLSEGSRTGSFTRWTLYNGIEGRAANYSEGTAKASYTDISIFSNNVKLQTTASSKRTVWLRNDGDAFYLLVTNANDPYGSFNGYRPFWWNFSDNCINTAGGLKFRMGAMFKYNTLPSAQQGFSIDSYDDSSHYTHQIIFHKDTAGLHRFFIRTYSYKDYSKYSDFIIGYNPVSNKGFVNSPETFYFPTNSAGHIGTAESHQMGAHIFLYGNSIASDASVSGAFRIRASKDNTYRDLSGKPDGTLIWNGSNIQTTSDERVKAFISDIPENVLDDWDNVEWIQYKYAEDIQVKGEENCRYHTGLIAQRVNRACSKVDILKYGILCHDTDSLYTGEDTLEHQDLWTVRYTEALCMEAAYQRRKNKILEKRISELEERLTKLEGIM